MSHISSITNSTYPYRGTLSRLDMNGEGVLSRSELAAEDKPGLLSGDSADDSDDALDSSSAAMDSFVAKLLQLPASGGSSNSIANLTQTGAASDDATPADLYQATYGQYAMEDMAA